MRGAPGFHHLLQVSSFPTLPLLAAHSIWAESESNRENTSIIMDNTLYQGL